MFESLTQRLQQVFRELRGQARLSEENIAAAMAEIETALLEADVNLQVARDFVAEVRAGCVGQEVLRSVTPGQQVVKLVSDRLVELLGARQVSLELSGPSPAVIMLVGLHGGGKTTTAAKLAKWLREKQGRQPLLVAGDIYRPAAITQLEVLGRDLGVPVHADRANPDVAAIARAGVEAARRTGRDTVLIDTAGRLQIDEQMVMELVRIRQTVAPREVLLVADAALGQEAVSVAEHFHRALDLTGVILTKLDGDARGGAAISIRKVTGRPIKFAGVGEKLADLEPFHPDRMASRILGMGDIVSLVEQAAAEVEAEDAAKMAEKIAREGFDFNDLREQFRQLRRMGGMEKLMGMLPGGAQLAGAQGFDEKKLAHLEAIICAMTPEERRRPDLLDYSRRRRLARGSGTKLEEVSQLLRQFTEMRKVMKRTGLLNRLMAGKTPLAGGAGLMSRGSNVTAPKHKRRKKGRR